MNQLWTNKALWLRVAPIASAAWLGGVIIISAVSRNFEWFPGSWWSHFDVYNFQINIGPAAITAAVGIAVIYAVCIGIPWIADAANTKQRKD